MGKAADVYFKTDPWRIIEEGFDPGHALVSESVFSLANEYMGVRGYLEEGYTGPTLLGSYFGGVYERKEQETSGYRGIVSATEFIVNGVDWLWIRMTIDGETLDLAKSHFTDFRRELDLKTGLLQRSFVWQIADGRQIKVGFSRLLSMEQVDSAVQRVTLQATRFEGKCELRFGLDGGTLHGNPPVHHWRQVRQLIPETGDQTAAVLGLEMETTGTGKRVFSLARVGARMGVRRPDGAREAVAFTTEAKDKLAEAVCSFSLAQGESITFERSVRNLVLHEPGEKDRYLSDCMAAQAGAITGAGMPTFAQVLSSNAAWWQRIWNRCDIAIAGDPLNQQGIRFCIFQLFQTYHGARPGSNIGAKGLTGEAYNGNAFWDTETYCLPFYVMHDPEAARKLMYFRYMTLPQAKERAKELDCAGAFYPIATISGRECCNLWQHASLQLQASTAVAYGIWFYEMMSGDAAFLEQQGLEMLIEICRMLATRGDFSEDQTRYGYFGVMGPDEFQMMVNHNCYTNYMARFTFNYTLESIQRVAQASPLVWASLQKKLGFASREAEAWERMAACMYIPREGLLYEQHEGFFRLPHIDVSKIPAEEFPLYHHWTYDRIYRNDMIKQPDVLMLMLLFNSAFTREELAANYDYYEPRCIHESSLSPSVHSILAAQLGRMKEATAFFAVATRMDLDNYNRNSGEGIHTTSIAAAWMNIVYGFGGLRTDRSVVSLSPVCPDGWEHYSFRFSLKGSLIGVEVDQEKVNVQVLEGEERQLCLYGETVTAGASPLQVKTRKFA